MPIRFEFELDDDDLGQFRKIIRDKRVGRSRVAIDDVVRAGSDLLTRARAGRTPHFILQMLEQIEPLVAMVTDTEWRLPEADIKRVLEALAYFAEPEDLIPDDLPGLGYLDDAVMVELACRDLQPELTAYRDFCAFREKETARRKAAGEPTDEVSRRDWLDARREQLMETMREERGLFRRLIG